jgi:predicted DsbA family dithiol-disulfide isomerase
MLAMAAEVGLPVVDRDWISNSRKALEASEFAREQGLFAPFHRAIFHAYFAEGRDIGKLDELREIARSVQLDDEAMAAALEAGRYTQRVDEDVRLAWQIGFTGVPAFILGNRAIVGAQSYEVFEEVMRLLGRDKRTADGSPDTASERPAG